MIYVLCNETVASGVVQSQLISKVSDGDVVLEICRLDTYFKQSKAHDDKSYTLIRLPVLLITQRIFLWNPFLIYLNWLLMLPIIIYLKFLVFKKSKIFLRGYMAGTLSPFLRRSQIIWDPRSLFFHEQKHYSSFTCWLEKLIANNVNCVNVVSTGMLSYFQSLSPKTDVSLIPCSPAIRFNATPSSNRKGLVYYGSLDANWNNKELYLDFFRMCRQVNEKYLITIISQDAAEVKDEWPDLNITFIKNPKSEHLSRLLASAKYGLFLYPDYPDAFTRYGVKFATYQQFDLITVASKNLTSVHATKSNVMTPEHFIAKIKSENEW